MTKVTLVFETEISEDCDTQYDWLHTAVDALEKALRKADSMEDLAEVFKNMIVGEDPSFPSFFHLSERDDDRKYQEWLDSGREDIYG